MVVFDERVDGGYENVDGGDEEVDGGCEEVEEGHVFVGRDAEAIQMDRNL